MSFIDVIAVELVEQNIHSAQELQVDLELDGEFNESNFDSWGVNEENVMAMVSHNMQEILKQAQLIQRKRFKAVPEIAAAIKPAPINRRVLKFQK